MSQRTNVDMQFGLSLFAMIILTSAGVGLGRVLTSDNMGLVFGFVVGVLVIFGVVAYLVAYRPLRRLEEAERDLAQVVSTDPATGLSNRAAILGRLSGEVDRATRVGEPLAFAAVNIDGFREINDQFGPNTGRSVLRSVGSLIAESCRQYDSAGRYDIENFLMVLPGTELDDAARAAERLRHRIEGTEFACDGKEVPVTVSIGVTQADIDHGESPDDMIKRALEALKNARLEGGNRVRASASLAFVEGASGAE